jgi:predicted aldo/keto reductase-like oxidoreductase
MIAAASSVLSRMFEGVGASLGASGASSTMTSSKNRIPRRDLGRTGEQVSIIGLGGHHLGRRYVTEQESIRIVRSALDSGVNFLDNCWDYNDGQSEVRVGKALRDGYRDKAFVMTKIDGRNKQAAAQQIDQSLERLQTDRIDLLQFHEIIRTEDPDRIFAEGGALEAVLSARKAGKLRFVGFTGHKNPNIHLHMLQVAGAHDFTFDTVQMPLNVMDAHFDSFEKNVLPMLIQKNIGVLGMKPMGDANLLRSGIVTPQECLHYAMSLPTSVVITGCDSMQILNQALEAARTFAPLGDQQRQELLARTASVGATGGLELYKTTQSFDGTAANPEWLG